MRFLIFGLLLSTFSLSAQQNATVQGDSTKIVAREKLYVHLDKTTFAVSDTLWFKAYLVNASRLDVSDLSGLIYIELINAATAEVVEHKSLATAMGITWGSFALTIDKFLPGNYTFRAYTNWMQNFGFTHFFSK